MNNLVYVFCDHSASTTSQGKVQDGSTLTMDVLATIASVASKQLNGEFADEWGGSYATRIGSCDGSDVADGEIEVAIFQNEDVSGAAGYHDRDPKGRPYIHVALDDAATLTTGAGALSVIVSHELLETAADPGANRWADRVDANEEALEVSDRVEDTSYEVNGVAVSNFLYQSAFDPGSQGPWDHMKVLSAEDGATPGGYVIERQQGSVAASETTKNSLTLTIRRRTFVSRPHPQAGSIGMTVQAAARYRARKNHPASRTSRRGAQMG